MKIIKPESSWQLSFLFAHLAYSTASIVIMKGEINFLLHKHLNFKKNITLHELLAFLELETSRQARGHPQKRKDYLVMIILYCTVTAVLE